MAAFKEDELADPKVLVCAAAEMFAMRRARDRVIPKGLVGEPGWDILLQLYANQPLEIPVSVLSDGSGIAPSCGSRWIAALAAEGFILPAPHPTTSGDPLVSLTPEGHRKIGDYLMAMLRCGRS